MSTTRRRRREARRDEQAWARGFAAGQRVAAKTRDELDAWLRGLDDGGPATPDGRAGP